MGARRRAIRSEKARVCLRFRFFLFSQQSIFAGRDEEDEGRRAATGLGEIEYSKARLGVGSCSFFFSRDEEEKLMES